ncbi:MAG: chemotaxis protein CheC [Lachnospiraceae bacterium]|nr:chemotaxis protein CheC [Ruminococcus sp.]MCM1275391.1 chemotaxis protein CheC [Lachnospiraceae bacterium]
MISAFSEFEEIHKSFLQEIGNMGAGNAATEVAGMFSSPTDISTPQVRINPASVAGKVADMLSAKAETFKITLCGDMKGTLMFVFPYSSIERLAGNFFPEVSVKSKDDMDEMTVSAVRETVNIAAASYANSISQMTGKLVDISIPEAVPQPSKEIGSDANSEVCFVKNSIEFLDTHNSFDVVFYPELGAITDFMGKIGLVC